MELEIEGGADFGAIVRRVLQQAKGALGSGFDELFVAPDIPPKKLANAVAKCAVPDDDEVVGLVDLTVFGSAKDAFVLGAQPVVLPLLWIRRPGIDRHGVRAF